jgi:hypothetical protein
VDRLYLTSAVALLLLATVSETVSSRTWHVSPTGQGDAATIEAAMDSAATGDSVLVAAGKYRARDTLYFKAGVHLIAEEGPTRTTVFVDLTQIRYAVVMQSNCTLTGFYIMSDYGNLVAVYVSGYGSTISHNIITGGTALRLAGSATVSNNVFWGVPAIEAYLSPNLVVVNNNILRGRFDCYFSGNLVASCNDVVGSTSCSAISSDPSNFNADPLFCGATPEFGSTFTLHSDSPCLPGRHPGGYPCGLIGPLGVGCAPVPVEGRTWGAIKEMYR